MTAVRFRAGLAYVALFTFGVAIGLGHVYFTRPRRVVTVQEATAKIPLARTRTPAVEKLDAVPVEIEGPASIAFEDPAAQSRGPARWIEERASPRDAED